MLTKHERETIDKLNSEISESYQNYIRYLSPKGFKSGGNDYKKMHILWGECNTCNINLHNYLDVITEKS